MIIKFCYLDSDIANTNDNGVSNEESSNNSNSSVTKKTSGSTTSNLDSSTIEAKDNTEILVKSIDKEKIGEFAAQIRKVRKPEPYKGKGIRYKDEHVRRKEGKKAA